jgi:hypothetical protein
MTDNDTTAEEARAMWDGLKEAWRRKEWGDITALSLAATYPDEAGDFEVTLLDANDELVFTPCRVNVLDPDGERQTVLGMVYEFYQEWQTDPGDGRDALHRHQWKDAKERLEANR